MNQTIITGRLTQDPELRYIPSTGKAVVNFTVAVDRRFGKEKKADFFNCQAWEKQAENIANYLHKGSKCLVVGSMQQRSYDDTTTGKKVYIWELIANEVEFLDSKNQNNQTQQQGIEPDHVSGSNFRTDAKAGQDNPFSQENLDREYRQLEDDDSCPF